MCKTCVYVRTCRQALAGDVVSSSCFDGGLLAASLGGWWPHLDCRQGLWCWSKKKFSKVEVVIIWWYVVMGDLLRCQSYNAEMQLASPVVRQRLMTSRSITVGIAQPPRLATYSVNVSRDSKYCRMWMMTGAKDVSCSRHATSLVILALRFRVVQAFTWPHFSHRRPLRWTLPTCHRSTLRIIESPWVLAHQCIPVSYSI